MFGKRLETKQTAGFGRGLLIAAAVHQDSHRSYTSIQQHNSTMADFVQRLDHSKLVFLGTVRTTICRMMSEISETTARSYLL